MECLPLSSVGLHLKWRAPPHQAWNGQIKGYRVLFVPFPDPDQPGQSKLNTARLSAVIGTSTALQGLLSFTNYSVQVLAYTSAGDGELSAPEACATESDGECRYLFQIVTECRVCGVNIYTGEDSHYHPLHIKCGQIFIYLPIIPSPLRKSLEYRKLAFHKC